jgi:hypothetical protein
MAERHALGARGLSLQLDAGGNSDQPYVLVISHDAFRAGAQMVLLNLLRQWKARRAFAVRVGAARRLLCGRRRYS